MFLKYFLKKLKFEKNQQTTKKEENYPTRRVKTYRKVAPFWGNNCSKSIIIISIALHLKVKLGNFLKNFDVRSQLLLLCGVLILSERDLLEQKQLLNLIKQILMKCDKILEPARLITRTPSREKSTMMKSAH